MVCGFFSGGEVLRDAVVGELDCRLLDGSADIRFR